MARRDPWVFQQQKPNIAVTLLQKAWDIILSVTIGFGIAAVVFAAIVGIGLFFAPGFTLDRLQDWNVWLNWIFAIAAVFWGIFAGAASVETVRTSKFAPLWLTVPFTLAMIFRLIEAFR